MMGVVNPTHGDRRPLLRLAECILAVAIVKRLRRLLEVGLEFGLPPLVLPEESVKLRASVEKLRQLCQEDELVGGGEGRVLGAT